MEGLDKIIEINRKISHFEDEIEGVKKLRTQFASEVGKIMGDNISKEPEDLPLISNGKLQQLILKLQLTMAKEYDRMNTLEDGLERLKENFADLKRAIEEERQSHILSEENVQYRTMETVISREIKKQLSSQDHTKYFENFTLCRLMTLDLTTTKRCIWIIPNFNELFATALDPKNKDKGINTTSPYIYSPKGYCMYGICYPSGMGSGYGEYMTIGLVMSLGRYDSILKWPYNNLIEIRILSENDKVVFTKKYKMSNIEKRRIPWKETRAVTTVRCDELKKNKEFIRENSLFIEIIVNEEN